MPHAGCTATESLDLLKELQLRRWARENYVVENRRDGGWHPVILAEMRAKDAELAAESHRRPVASSYVPLAPSPVTHHLLDGPHTAANRPNISQIPERVEYYVHG